MSEIKITLSDEQIDNALVCYARGKTSSQVIEVMIFEYEELEDSPETRAMLRDQLRSVNPNDKRFSRSKYGVRFDMVSLVVVEELRQQSREAMQGVISSIGGGMEELDDITESMLGMLNNASDFDITSNTEYLNTVRTLASLQKIRIDGVNAVSHLVDQLCRLHTLRSVSGDEGVE